MSAKNIISVPRLLLSGVLSNGTSSLLGLGIVAQLRRQGLGVSCCVVGPHLQFALALKRLTGRPAPCLDMGLLSQPQVLTELYLSGLGADLLLILSSQGLFDSREAGCLEGCAADLARISDAPVILSADPKGFGNGFGALVKGYSEYMEGCRLGGVLLSNLGSDENWIEAQRVFFEEALIAHGLPPVLGALPDLLAGVPELACGTFEGKNNTAFPREFFVNLANCICDHVRMPELIAAAGQARSLETPGFTVQPQGRRVKIAVADDVCFGLCFQNNLELFRYFGAELVSFSPLADQRLPRGVGGLYLTGGYLAEYGKELEMNGDMMQAIRVFAAKGGLVYAEGAGTAYLCRKYQSGEGAEWVDGVGLIPGQAKAKAALPSYVEAVSTEESILGRQGCELRGVDGGEWEIQLGDSVVRVLRLSGAGRASSIEGYSPGAQILCTSAFFNLASNPEAAASIVEIAEVEGSISRQRSGQGG